MNMTFPSNFPRRSTSDHHDRSRSPLPNAPPPEFDPAYGQHLKQQHRDPRLRGGVKNNSSTPQQLGRGARDERNSDGNRRLGNDNMPNRYFREGELEHRRSFYQNRIWRNSNFANSQNSSVNRHRYQSPPRQTPGTPRPFNDRQARPYNSTGHRPRRSQSVHDRIGSRGPCRRSPARSPVPYRSQAYRDSRGHSPAPQNRTPPLDRDARTRRHSGSPSPGFPPCSRSLSRSPLRRRLYSPDGERDHRKPLVRESLWGYTEQNPRRRLRSPPRSRSPVKEFQKSPPQAVEADTNQSQMPYDSQRDLAKAERQHKFEKGQRCNNYDSCAHARVPQQDFAAPSRYKDLEKPLEETPSGSLGTHPTLQQLGPPQGDSTVSTETPRVEEPMMSTDGEGQIWSPALKSKGSPSIQPYNPKTKSGEVTGVQSNTLDTAPGISMLSFEGEDVADKETFAIVNANESLGATARHSALLSEHSHVLPQRSAEHAPDDDQAINRSTLISGPTSVIFAKEPETPPDEQLEAWEVALRKSEASSTCEKMPVFTPVTPNEPTTHAAGDTGTRAVGDSNLESEFPPKVFAEKSVSNAATDSCNVDVLHKSFPKTKMADVQLYVKQEHKPSLELLPVVEEEIVDGDLGNEYRRAKAKPLFETKPNEHARLSSKMVLRPPSETRPALENEALHEGKSVDLPFREPLVQQAKDSFEPISKCTFSASPVSANTNIESLGLRIPYVRGRPRVGPSIADMMRSESKTEGRKRAFPDPTDTDQGLKRICTEKYLGIAFPICDPAEDLFGILSISPGNAADEEQDIDHVKSRELLRAVIQLAHALAVIEFGLAARAENPDKSLERLPLSYSKLKSAYGDLSSLICKIYRIAGKNPMRRKKEACLPVKCNENLYDDLKFESKQDEGGNIVDYVVASHEVTVGKEQCDASVFQKVGIASGPASEDEGGERCRNLYSKILQLKRAVGVQLEELVCVSHKVPISYSLVRNVTYRGLCSLMDSVADLLNCAD